MKNIEELASSIIALPLAERIKVLAAVTHECEGPNDSSGSFSPQEIALLSERAAMPADQYIAWETVRDSILTRLSSPSA